jgi:hypothetical protein
MGGSIDSKKFYLRLSPLLTEVSCRGTWPIKAMAVLQNGTDTGSTADGEPYGVTRAWR